jgi:cobalt/nickel transport protein
MRQRTFFLAALVVALVIAGVGSYYASTDPDGLEYVAEQTGFQDKAEDSKTADGAFADYQTKGVDDERLGGGLAGVVGVLLVLLVMGGVAYAVRRRRPSRDEP